MRLFRIVAIPLTAGLILGGAVASAFGAPVVTNTLATLPAGSVPTALAVDDSGAVYSLDSNADRITKVAADGTVTAAWASPGGTTKDIVSTPGGTLFTANFATGTISRVAPDGTLTAAYASLGAGSGPSALTITESGTVYTANAGSNSISKIDAAGSAMTFATLPPTSQPFDITVSGAGDIYTLNRNQSVSKVSAAGAVTPVFAALHSGAIPVNLVVDSAEHVFVLESDVDVIEEFDANGSRVQFIALPSAAGRIAIDAQDNIFVTLSDMKTIGLIPHGRALVPSIAPLTPGTDYTQLAVTRDHTVYATGLRSALLVTRIALAASITSPPITPTAVIDRDFHATVTATGYEPLTYSFKGNVPPGLTISPTGTISGAPTATGTFLFAIVASNMFEPTSLSSQRVIFTVTAAPPPSPTPTPTPTASATATPRATPGVPIDTRTVGGPSALAQTGGSIAIPAALALLLLITGAVGFIVQCRSLRPTTQATMPSTSSTFTSEKDSPPNTMP